MVMVGMAALQQPLHLPVALEAYARSSGEMQAFPQYMHRPCNALDLKTVKGIFTSGFITHAAFAWQDRQYTVASMSTPRGKVYLALALPDLQLAAEARDQDGAQQGQGQQLSSKGAIVPLPSRCVSMPVSYPLGWDLTDLDMPHEMALSAPPLPPVPLQASLACAKDGAKFMEDLLRANDDPVALQRYKAVIRLLSLLRRRLSEAGVSCVGDAGSWATAEQVVALKQVLMVGECLARFGSADFGERSNSSRAINAKDYTQLLSQYLTEYGAVFEPDFINALGARGSQGGCAAASALADEALTVRSLLYTRCEANDVISHQLVRAIGLERSGKGSGGGGAFVVNTSLVNANPVNNATANPVNTANTSSTNWNSSTAKARLLSAAQQHGWLLLAAAGAGALFLRAKMGAGFTRQGRHGRRGRGERQRSDDDDGSVGSGSNRVRQGRSRRGGGSTSTERLAVRFVAACGEDVRALAANTALLEDDWRFGKWLRFASPGNPFPPGYQAVDAQKCTLEEFYALLEGEDLQPLRRPRS